jgi:hypothetical protein
MTTRRKPENTRREIDTAALGAIVERTRGALSAEEFGELKTAIDALAQLKRELERESISHERMRKLLFGSGTEKTSRVLGDDATDREATDANSSPAVVPASDPPEKAAGHGRNGAAAYTGAKHVKVPHASLEKGAHCPGCVKGKVYPLRDPRSLIRVKGMTPLEATVYDCDQLRCNLCGEVFAAQAPEGVGQQKYDETATSMVGLLKYGTGLPFNRLEKLQHGLGIPLPAATQWELVEAAADLLTPVHLELVKQAAGGEVLHNDDTSAKILELSAEQRREALGDDADKRTGVFTSGIVSTREGQHPIALFFTGPKHSGENLAAVLARRAADLPTPIQMCDASTSNTAGEFETIVAACCAHARRQFVDVVDQFPGECRVVLETFKEVYKNDAQARTLSHEERLRFHQEHSAPLMEKLEKWMRAQTDEHHVEPNSGLGQAIAYMTNHWSRLTLFLSRAGAPLDNNICERALKKAILHRKNSLFFKTLNGARVSDLFMSLIYTAELNGVGPFHYLVALQRNLKAVVANPADWMPWDYSQTLARFQGPAPPP